MKLGVGTAQHAIIAGKTGSGKSSLLHALITSALMKYSPENLRLVLLDFKKG
ncbi:MAG: FtsK/SpoIIIE domain-containing protein [Pirellulales bacterium]